MKLNAASRLLSHKLDEKWVPGVRGYHYAVGCLLLAADTLNFSFQLRSADSDAPNCYSCWGGSIDGNEEAFQALRRELREETGYSGEMRIYPLMTYYDQDRAFYYYNNLVLIPKQFKINPPPEFAKESAGNTWVPFNEWPDPLHPGLQALLDDRTSMSTVEQIIDNIDRAHVTGADPMKLAAAQRLTATTNPEEYSGFEELDPKDKKFWATFSKKYGELELIGVLEELEKIRDYLEGGKDLGKLILYLESITPFFSTGSYTYIYRGMESEHEMELGQSFPLKLKSPTLWSQDRSWAAHWATDPGTALLQMKFNKQDVLIDFNKVPFCLGPAGREPEILLKPGTLQVKVLKINK